MPLPAGTRFGDCEILAPLGAGGMGEVYRARDTSLGREVAVKILPAQLARDPERLRRFEQEARASAALNHPNILAVYSFGAKDQHVPYLITELLQGQTLRERLLQGPIPARKAVDYALQITRGLAAAHERGIVHRDLKPDNLFLTRDGLVKILDFGLAKLVKPDPAASPYGDTLTSTEAGLVLGTAGYMSPEQVRGQPVDHRSDIFSLGAILYEMLCGQRAFQGATSADTLSAILKDEPAELSGLVANLPPALGRIVHRCLEKDPAERFQSARDLAFNLDLLSRDESGPILAVSRTPLRKWLISSAIVLAVVLLAVAGLWISRLLGGFSTTDPVVLKRLTDFPGMEESPALSPDGKSVAFTADLGGRRQVWVRLLAGGAPLQLTHDDADHQAPRWSPDSSSLIYFSPAADGVAPGKIWQVPALGGPPRPIAISFAEGDFSHDGRSIAYFRGSQQQIELVTADRDGANPRVVSRLSPDFIYSNLRWSPDGKMLGFQRGRIFNFDIFYVPVRGGEPGRITQDADPLAGFAWLPDSSGVVYGTSRDDTVLYLPVMNLWSMSIDGKHLRQLTFGETSYVSPDVDHSGNVVSSRLRIQFDIWKFPVGDNPLENVAGAVQVTHQTGTVQTPTPSPDDRSIAFLSDSGGHGNIWVLDQPPGQSRQITFEQDPHIGLGVPVWSPDGAHIAYVSRSRTGWNVDQWIINPDGTGAHRVSTGGGWATWSADSRWLYFAEPTPEGRFFIKKVTADGATMVKVRDEGEGPAISADGTLYYSLEQANLNGSSDLQVFRANPEDASPTPLVRIPGSRLPPWLMVHPVLSPDAKWLAMTLADGSVTNIWAQPTSGGPMRRLTDFGRQATFITRRVSWSPDGKAVYAAVGKGEADIVLLNNLLK